MSENQLHVAGWGRNSWPGTAEQPFATVHRAQQAVRAGTAGMDADIIVNVHAGTYTLTAPFRLLAAEGDSGENGHRVVYQAYGYGTDSPDQVVLSGGRQISGWRPHHGATGVWRAEVGDLDTRQLFVDGRRAERAALEGGIPGRLTRTESGYVTDSTAPQSWSSPADVEFVYRGVYPWSEARCGVAGVSGDEHSTVITMDQPAFGWAAQLYQGAMNWSAGDWPESVDAPAAGDVGEDGWSYSDVGTPTSAENSLSFLTRPGTFVLDRSRPGHHVLFYLPRDGEALTRVSVVAPVLETLVHGRGAPGAPLHDIILRGITFADATWLRPSRPEGFLHYHGSTYYDGGRIETVTFAEGQGSVAVPAESARVPAHVVFDTTERITVEGNRFTRLGANALEFSHGSRDNVVRGNVFDDVSGGAIALGAHADGAGSNRGNRVENNWVHHIGREYRGSPGIHLTGTQDTIVAHNQIDDVPHCGIVVDGGEAARGAHVLDNLVFTTMTALADGGGIYLTGRQGASFASGAVVRGNVVHDTITSYNFGLYTDYGAAWVTVQANAVYRSDTPVVLQVSPPLEHVVFVGNFWDADPDGHDQPPKGVTVAGNTRLPREDFERALAADPAGADIVAGAGLEPAYRHLVTGGGPAARQP
jgi:Right handed beta helix region